MLTIPHFFRAPQSSLDSAPPPDGGLQAWTQVLIGHLINFNIWGQIQSFGIFQPIYSSTLSQTPSSISWIGSLQILLVYFVGTFSGRAMDAGYFKLMLVLGLFLQVFGIFMTSLASSYWQLLLSQGICQGLGNGLLFCPIVALVSTYFTTKKTLAISCAACGAATGGMVFPAIARQLLDKVGFAWTVRVMGFVALFNAIIALTFARTRLPSRSTGPIVEWSAFKDRTYSFYAVGTFLTFWGSFFAFYYVRTYATDILGVPSSTTFIILLIMNGMGLPGRILPAILADRYFGALSVFIPIVFLAGVLLLCWIAVESLAGLYVFAVFYGFFGGGVQSLFAASLAALTQDLGKVGVRVGMVFSIVGVASLTGPPLAGALIQRMEGKYVGACIFGGVTMICGCGFIVAARLVKKDGQQRIERGKSTTASETSLSDEETKL
ncbi:hypothetical protein LTS18_010286 [Coniosporium uncinatum]|uniref:Uncharacterized protein n=1 Tax=Coniosporium uncinatum TaxID=93489 RepID=A0ACC3DLG7_9PEZI|nr:hypothetical protein LTS18_010286 [Coniosporium uncinatum]